MSAEAERQRVAACPGVLHLGEKSGKMGEEGIRGSECRLPLEEAWLKKTKAKGVITSGDLQ